MIPKNAKLIDSGEYFTEDWYTVWWAVYEIDGEYWKYSQGSFFKWEQL